MFPFYHLIDKPSTSQMCDYTTYFDRNSDDDPLSPTNLEMYYGVDFKLLYKHDYNGHGLKRWEQGINIFVEPKPHLSNVDLGY